MERGSKVELYTIYIDSERSWSLEGVSYGKKTAVKHRW